MKKSLIGEDLTVRPSCHKWWWTLTLIKNGLVSHWMQSMASHISKGEDYLYFLVMLPLGSDNEILRHPKETTFTLLLKVLND